MDITISGHVYKNVTFNKRAYSDGNLAVTIDSAEGPVATASVNLDILPEPGCIWVKNYSENEGVLEEMLRHNLIVLTGREAAAGYATVCEAKVLF